MIRYLSIASSAMFLALLAGCGPAGETPAEPQQEPQESTSTAMPAPTDVEVIATGANIAGANGVHFGPDGMLYVASVVGSSLTVLDPDTGEIAKRLGAEDGVIGPDDVAFASDGSFYWTSILTGEVAGFSAEGQRVVAAQLAPGVNPITFSDDDRLFVAQCFLGTNLYELDPAGGTAPRLISDSLGPGCGLNGMDWGPDDRLYGPRWFAGEVVSFDVDDNSMRLEADGFAVPASIKFNSKGELHVLDTGRGEVVKVIDGDKEVVARLDPGLDNFAFDADDRIFVSSFADGFVKRVNADGSQTTLQPGGISHAGGIVFHDGRLILADLHAIRGYDTDGALLFTQRNVVGVGEMGGAMNVSVDGSNLILSSWFDNDVRIWDPANEKRMAQYPELALPVAAVRYAGNVAVAEHGKHRVVSLAEDGTETELATDLPAPTGLVVEQGDLYVSDRQLGQILMIASGGKALAEPYVVASNLTTPEGFVVTDKGFVVVEADAGKVTEVNSAGDRRVLAELPPGSQAAPGTPPSQIFNGIAMGADGNLYVPDETGRKLYKIRYRETSK